MDILKISIDFLTIVISLLIFYGLKSYLSKYIEAKGTNQATKEDIGEITVIVENIKSDLVQQNEFIKSQLSFQNQHKLNLKAAEREAIFDFNKKISAWLFSMLRFSFSSYDIDNYKELKLISSEFLKRQYECDLAEAQLILFIHDNDFLELKRDLIISVLNYQRIIEKAMHDFYFKCSSYEAELELEKNNLARQSQIRGQFYIEFPLLTQTHITNSMVQFKEVHLLQVKMRNLIHNRLKQLEIEEKNIY